MKSRILCLMGLVITAGLVSGCYSLLNPGAAMASIEKHTALQMSPHGPGNCTVTRLSRLEPQTQAALEHWGITFTNVDGLAALATLPPGWKKIAGEYKSCQYLADEKARRRAVIHQQNTFRGRKETWVYVMPRYSISIWERGDAQGKPMKKGRNTHYRTVVYDGQTIIHESGVRKIHTSGYEHEEQAEQWLAERFPKWKDAAAYWD